MSDLLPNDVALDAATTATPLVKLQWTARGDVEREGDDLICGPGSSLAVDLDRGFARFVSRVEGGTVRITADDKLLHAGGQGDVRLDVSDVRRLVIATTGAARLVGPALLAWLAMVGRPLAWDRDGLLALMAIGPEQLAEAAQFWRDHAPPAFAAMLDAPADGGFTFDPAEQRYYTPHGRRVRDDDARAALLAFLASAEWDFELRAAAMARGRTPVGAWQDAMARDVRSLYLASAAVGAGGLALLTPLDLADVCDGLPPGAGTPTWTPSPTAGSGLGDALARLDRFARQVPTQASVAATARRAGLYARPGYGVAEEATRAARGRAGYTMERSVLGPNENHCRTVPGVSEGCVDCAEAGWVPIGTLPPPGQRTCGPGCRCRMEYARSVVNGVAMLSAAGDGHFRMVEDEDGEGYHRVFFPGPDDGGGKPANPAWLNPKVVGKKAAAKNQKAHVAKHGALPAGTTPHPPPQPKGNVAVTPKAKAKLDKHGVSPEQLIEHADEADGHHIGSSKGKHGEGTTIHVTGVKNGKTLYAKSVGPGHKVWHQGGAAAPVPPPGDAPPGANGKPAPTADVAEGTSDDDLVTVIPHAPDPAGQHVHQTGPSASATAVSPKAATILQAAGVTAGKLAEQVSPHGDPLVSVSISKDDDVDGGLWVGGKTASGKEVSDFVGPRSLAKIATGKEVPKLTVKTHGSPTAAPTTPATAPVTATPAITTGPAPAPHVLQSTMPADGVKEFSEAKAELAAHGLTPEQVVDHFAAPGSKLTYASVKTFPQPGGATPKASVSWTPEGGTKQHVSQADISALPKTITPVPKPAYTPTTSYSAYTAASPVQLKVHPDAASASASDVKAQVASAASHRPAGFPATAHDLTVVRKLGGSTGAELVQDAAGNKFVRKAGANPAHLINEYHAESAYRAAGVAVPESAVYNAPGGPLKLSRYVEGTEYGKLSGAAKEAAKADLAKGFAADALMGNYDVLGASGDNVLVDKSGKAWRIDVGGSMSHRAQGLVMKTGDQWNAHPTELWTMRQSGVDGSGNAYTGQMTDTMKGVGFSTIAKQAGDVASHRAAILAAVPEADRAVLGGRLDAMAKVADTTKTLVGDNYREEYADTFCKHQVGIAKAGIIDRLPKELKQSGGRKSVTLVDENGKEFDDLRGSGSTVAHVATYINSAGGDYAKVKSLADGQAGSSWSGQSLAAKMWMAKQAGIDPSTMWWGKHTTASEAIPKATAEYAAANKDGKFDETMAALHAWTHATLTEIDLPTVDKKAGTIRLIRGEHGFLGQDKKGPISVGDSFTPQRSSLESTGMFKGSLGSNLFAIDVPVHRVLGTYMQARDAAGHSDMFLGDDENEALANINGLKVKYLGPNGSSTKIPVKAFG